MTTIGGAALGEFVDGLAERHGGATALIDGAQAVSFEELARASRRTARGLAELGIGQGDRVAVWLPNGVAWPVLFFACARLGAITFAVNTRFRSAEVGDIVGRSRSRVLALQPGFKGIDFLSILRDADPAALDNIETIVTVGDAMAPPALPEMAARRAVTYADLSSPRPLDRSRGDPEIGALVFTTSGTTRAPKFVLHSHRSLATHAHNVAPAFGYDTEDAVLLQALPLCGTFGHVQLMAALAGGRPTVLLDAFDAARAVAAIREHRVSHFNGTDEMLLNVFAAAGPGDLETLAACGFAAFNPAAGDVVAAGERAGVIVHGLYGMSECQALFARQPGDAEPDRRRLAGGIPTAPTARLRARDPDSGTVLPVGETGEIELTGPSLMTEYLGDDLATRGAFTDDGFFRTGDLGYTTDDGGFVFLTRMGDVLRLGGFLVSPAEIEAQIERHPAVLACQVVGAEAASGPVAAAFVIAQPGAHIDENEIRIFCATNLAKFKVPAAVYAVEAFPVTESANGVKIQRGRLRAMAEARLAKSD